jgi:hypothetical protein
VPHEDRIAVYRAEKRPNPIDCVFARLLAGNDFDRPKQVGRIPPVTADDPLGRGRRAGGDIGNGQPRGVRGQDRLAVRFLGEVAEQLPFGGQVLGDRFEDQVGVGHRPGPVERVGRVRYDRVRIERRQPPVGENRGRVADSLARTVEVRLPVVDQSDVTARARELHGEPVAHCSRTDDCDGADVLHAHSCERPRINL